MGILGNKGIRRGESTLLVRMFQQEAGQKKILFKNQ